jgi:tetratricopeptide (TPR) repeat protein
MGPFHDDWAAAQSLIQAPETALAWFGLIIIAVLAVLKRRRWPWLSLAVAWFLLGHALESTLFNLEIYFEHRNYLPSVGILLALNAALWQIPDTYKRAAFGIAAMYLCLLGFVLYQVTAAWGNPDVAGQLWTERHPNSERAQQFLTNRLLAKGDIEEALRLINNLSVRHPERAGLGLQKIQLLCETGQDVYQPIQDVIPLIAKASMDHSMADTAEKLMALSETHKCPGLNETEIHKLLDALLRNNVILNLPATQFRLHHLKARLYFQSHALDPTMEELEAAFKILPDLDTGVLMAGVLATAGLPDQARIKLQEVKQFLPNNPIVRKQWLNRLAEIENDLNQNSDAITISIPQK